MDLSRAKVRTHDRLPPLPRDADLFDERRARGRRQLRARARASAPREGRARHGQDPPRRGDRRVAGRRAHRVEREEHDQGARRPLRLRHGAAPLRLALRRRRREGHPPLHQARPARPRAEERDAGRPAHRRGRQGRPRVPERSAPRARPHALPRHRDGRRDRREGAPRRRHHEQQREGAARRVPSPVRVPLHRLPRSSVHAARGRRAPPRALAEPRRADDEGLLRDPREQAPPQAPVDERAHRLDRRPPPRGRRRGEARPDAPRSSARS